MAAFVHLVSFSCQSLGDVRRRRSSSLDVANSVPESRRQNGRVAPCRTQLTNAVQVGLPPILKGVNALQTLGEGVIVIIITSVFSVV